MSSQPEHQAPHAGTGYLLSSCLTCASSFILGCGVLFTILVEDALGDGVVARVSRQCILGVAGMVMMLGTSIAALIAFWPPAATGIKWKSPFGVQSSDKVVRSVPIACICVASAGYHERQLVKCGHFS